MPLQGRGASVPHSGRQTHRHTNRWSDATSTGRLRTAEKGQRIHGCVLCGKVYTRNEHLSRHQQNHTPGRYHCESPGCDKTFHERFYLEKHKLKEWPFNFPQPSHNSTRHGSHSRGRVETTPQARQRPLRDTSGETHQSTSSGVDEYESSPTPTTVSNGSYLSPSPIPHYVHQSSSHQNDPRSPQVDVATGRDMSTLDATPRFSLSPPAPLGFMSWPPQAVPAPGHSYSQPFSSDDAYVNSQNRPSLPTTGLQLLHGMQQAEIQYEYPQPSQLRQHYSPPAASSQPFQWQGPPGNINQGPYNVYNGPATHYSHTLPHQEGAPFPSQGFLDNRNTNFLTTSPGSYTPASIAPSAQPQPIYYPPEGSHESTSSRPASYEHISGSRHHSVYYTPNAANHTTTSQPEHTQEESENVPFYPHQQTSQCRGVGRHRRYHSSN